MIELSTGQSIMNVVKNPGWCDLSDQTIVLCGAGSAMGPFPILMALGATVVGLDLKIPGIWERLIKIAKASPGRLIMPLSEPCADEGKLAALAGCDLLRNAPEIGSWLLEVEPAAQFTGFEKGRRGHKNIGENGHTFGIF